LTELRPADLRFTPGEAAAFLTKVMGLSLSASDIAALETRTEGWIAGLQLAALSMQGRQDISGFIRAFAGDNRYIVDYLVEEVLQHQPEGVRRFLLQTAILDRLHEPPARFTADPRLNRQSIKKLAALKPKVIGFGHGPVLLDRAPFWRSPLVSKQDYLAVSSPRPISHREPVREATPRHVCPLESIVGLACWPAPPSLSPPC
jgi:hypothetical protein